MSTSPKISVLMPVYNAAKYLATSLESIRAQTFGDFEFLAVDDGSTDRSLAILQQFGQKDPRIKILSRPNTGIVGALNDGLAAAKGEFVARMDADDLSHPERFAIQQRHLAAHPELVAIGSAVRMIDPGGAPLKLFKANTDPQSLRAAVIAGQDIGIIHPAMMARRSVLEQAGGYREQYKFVEDLDLFLRLLDFGQLGNVPEVLLDYRQHLQSTNSQRSQLQSELMAQCLAEHQQRWGLPPCASLAPPPLPAYPGARRVLWAFWAVEGGHPLTALRHAAWACVQSGLATEARKCLNYAVHNVCAANAGRRKTAPPQ